MLDAASERGPLTAALRVPVRYEPPLAPRLHRALTMREWEVVALVALGHGYKDIAARLVPRVSWKTAKRHVEKVADLLPPGLPPLRRIACYAPALLQSRDLEGDA